MRFEDRCEAIRYRVGDQFLVASSAPPRVFASSVLQWEPSCTPLTGKERIKVIEDLLVWMSEPPLLRRLFGLRRARVVLVVDEQDDQRSLLEVVPTRLASAGVRVTIEYNQGED
jgi:hypothetical protein